MASMMTHYQHANAFRIYDAKQHRVRKAMNDAAPDLRFDDRELHRVPSDPRYDCVNLASEFQLETGSGVGIEGRRLVYIANDGGMKLDPH